MRSKPQDPNKKKVAIVLIVLSVIWLFLGTAFFIACSFWINNNTLADKPVQNQEEQAPDQSYDNGKDDTSDYSAGQEDTEDDQDQVDDMDGGQNDDDMNDSDEDFDDDPDDDDDVDDDDDGDDIDDDAVTLTVDAWDGFAAVRKGRGTGYQQVGRLNNGEKVAVTDLENGWYKIASGKWKGYYLHRSSLK